MAPAPSVNHANTSRTDRLCLPVDVVECFGEGHFEAWKQLTVGAGCVLASSTVPDVLEKALETLVRGLMRLW